MIPRATPIITAEIASSQTLARQVLTQIVIRNRIKQKMAVMCEICDIGCAADNNPMQRHSGAAEILWRDSGGVG